MALEDDLVFFHAGDALTADFPTSGITVSNPSGLTDPAVSGGALDFDGSEGLTIDHASDLFNPGAGAMGVALRIRIDAGNVDNDVQFDCHNTFNGFGGYLRNAGGRQFVFWQAGPGSVQLRLPAGTYDNGTFITLVATRDAAGNWTTYADGSEVTPDLDQIGNASIGSCDTITLGAQEDGTDATDCAIDFLALWERELTASEMANNMNEADIKSALGLGGGADPTITSVGGDDDIDQGESAVIVGTNFEAAQGTGNVVISPTDNIADGNAVSQTETVWGDTSITFTVNFPAGVNENDTAYLFVTNDSGNSNANGFAFTRQDVTGPAVSAPTAGSLTPTAVTPSATTNEETGTIYMVVVPDGDAPSVAQVKAGQDSGGGAAIAAANQAVSATGVQNFAQVTGLTPATDYELYFVHTDAANNDSAVAFTGFQTAALPTITLPAMKNNTGTVLANETGAVAAVYNATTGALVVRKTGQTTNGSGVMTIADAAMSTGVDYYVVIELSGGARGLSETIQAV